MGWLHERLTCLLAFVLLASCTPSAWAGQANAAIASAHPLATEAGRVIIEQGGNAFDAAVAVAATLAVVEHYSSGLGGGGFFLLHRARDGRQVVVDAREVAPRKAVPARFLDASGELLSRATLDGPRAAGIPGTPAALDHLARKYGRLSLAQSLAPAIRLADEGFPVDPRYRTIAQTRRAQLLAQPEAAAQFLTNSEVPAEGTILRQPRLAATLRVLARQGRHGFYRGAVADELVRAVNKGGGLWSLSDLARYRIKERTPIAFEYRGVRVVSAPPPSAGGLALAESLNMLARFDLEKLSEVQRMHLVVEAMRRAYQDRNRYLGDPDFITIPVARMLSRAYAAQRVAGIDPDNATASAALGEESTARQGENTTHFSIVDREGNRVAATLSINTLFGSGFVAGRTGVLLNNQLDDFAIKPLSLNVYGLAGSRSNLMAPGKRPLSSMSPTFLEDERGVMVLGTPGGSRIISMILLAILGHGAQPSVDVQGLVAAPRYHHQYIPDRIEFEPDAFPSAALDELQLMGHVIQVIDRKWGNMQAVWVNKTTGRAVAVSDPRGQGSGMAWY